MAKEALEAVYQQVTSNQEMINKIVNGRLPEDALTNLSLDEKDKTALEEAAKVAKNYFDDEHLLDQKDVLLNMILTFGLSLNSYILRRY